MQTVTNQKNNLYFIREENMSNDCEDKNVERKYDQDSKDLWETPSH